MSSGNIKDLRKQVRNVTQELLPELLQTEVFKGLSEKLLKETAELVIIRLMQIETDIQNKLIEIETRARDVQTYNMNQIQAVLKKAEAKDETK